MDREMICRKDMHRRTVIAMLNPMKKELLCVRGNCDTEVDQMVLEFQILADYCYLNLSGDPEEKNSDVTIFATHGHVYNPHKLPMLKDGDILVERTYAYSGM